MKGPLDREWYYVQFYNRTTDSMQTAVLMGRRTVAQYVAPFLDNYYREGDSVWRKQYAENDRLIIAKWVEGHPDFERHNKDGVGVPLDCFTMTRTNTPGLP